MKVLAFIGSRGSVEEFEGKIILKEKGLEGYFNVVVMGMDGLSAIG